MNTQTPSFGETFSTRLLVVTFVIVLIGVVVTTGNFGHAATMLTTVLAARGVAARS